MREKENHFSISRLFSASSNADTLPQGNGHTPVKNKILIVNFGVVLVQ